MAISVPSMTIVAVFISLTVITIIGKTSRRFSLPSYLSYTWLFFLSFTLADNVSFPVGLWLLAVLSFIALREYFSLVNIRLQDRIGILAAYLSIPFMTYFIHTGWYGMFIISIPVYAFLAIPLCVSLGGKETEGTVFSVGAIDFGLFLFVYCLGHIGYLLFFSTWMAGMLILTITLCDAVGGFVYSRLKSRLVSRLVHFAACLPLTVPLTVVLSPWTGIPGIHSVVLGLIIPLLVVLGHHTIGYMEKDLGIVDEKLLPGRGLVLDSTKSIFYTAPVAFHYIRYFLGL